MRRPEVVELVVSWNGTIDREFDRAMSHSPEPVKPGRKSADAEMLTKWVQHGIPLRKSVLDLVGPRPMPAFLIAAILDARLPRVHQILCLLTARGEVSRTKKGFYIREDAPMPTITVNPPPYGTRATPCRSCGAPVVFLQSVPGKKWVPFDADPSPDSINQDGTWQVDTKTCHFATCPNYRRK